ncbi:MAG: S-methyl-5-thioribose-phosphate isomerase [Verrucomicrobiota bacterium]
MKPSPASERSLRLAPDGVSVLILDQTLLPHEVKTVRLRTLEQAAHAIRTMQVRGSNLIGVTAAYGMALALRADATNSGLEAAYSVLIETRPTAVNLRWALDLMRDFLRPMPASLRVDAAYAKAAELLEEDVATNRSIGDHGLALFRKLLAKRPQGEPLRVLTHCNAGRIATLDWGTATAPIYRAQQEGLPIHVWVSETRPRNQGAALTAWELGGRGVPHTLIADNAAGHLMQHGLVDVVIVGADRVTAAGDVANKIGTYLKALAAREHKIPFYVAFVGGSVDWNLRDGVREIPIEQRSAREVTHITGVNSAGKRVEVRLTPEGTPARNDGFDVTPAKLITGLITERGVCRASVAALARLYDRSDRLDRGKGRTVRAPRS